MNQETRKNRKRIWAAILLLTTGLLIWGISWATYARPPLPEAQAALDSDALVEVSLEPWLVFDPVGEQHTGLIFYPGGRIDPRGYAVLMRALAEQGYLVVVPSMPINMAIFNSNAADGIMAEFRAIKNWVIAGHSVGGVAAAIYTNTHPDQIDGLAIWASYPPESADLSASHIPVYLIYGELDPAANAADVENRAELLPADTVYLEIKGGDHHQFGTYLIDAEDDLAVISREDQQEQIIQATLELLGLISEGKR